MGLIFRAARTYWSHPLILVPPLQKPTLYPHLLLCHLSSALFYLSFLLSLTQRKQLYKEKRNLVVCVGMPRPSGPVVLVLSDGNLLVLQPGAESIKKTR